MSTVDLLCAPLLIGAIGITAYIVVRWLRHRPAKCPYCGKRHEQHYLCRKRTETILPK